MARKIALVTGSNGGIGIATCRKLQQCGFEVIGVDVELGKEDWKSYACDLGVTTSRDSLIACLRRDHAPIVALVNNAAFYQAKEAADITENDWDRTFAVNVKAPFFLARAICDRLIEAGLTGSVVNTASIAATAGTLFTDYGASKAALIGLTRSLSRTYGRAGIRINAVAPGLVDTAMGTQVPSERRAAMISATPLGRAATPAEVADTIAFLAGPDSSYVTGTVVEVTGGFR